MLPGRPGHAQRVPAAVLGATLSLAERAAALKALSRLAIPCVERQTQDNVAPDECVFIIVGSDLAAAERLAARCRCPRQPPLPPVRCSVRGGLTAARRCWWQECEDSGHRRAQLEAAARRPAAAQGARPHAPDGAALTEGVRTVACGCDMRQRAWLRAAALPALRRMRMP